MNLGKKKLKFWDFRKGIYNFRIFDLRKNFKSSPTHHSSPDHHSLREKLEWQTRLKRKCLSPPTTTCRYPTRKMWSFSRFWPKFSFPSSPPWSYTPSGKPSHQQWEWPRVWRGLAMRKLSKSSNLPTLSMKTRRKEGEKRWKWSSPWRNQRSSTSWPETSSTN